MWPGDLTRDFPNLDKFHTAHKILLSSKDLVILSRESCSEYNNRIRKVNIKQWTKLNSFLLQ